MNIYNIMCGIFGYIGYDNCFDYGIYALNQLQNRGYDSAGCCSIDSNNELFIKKYASNNIADSIKTLENTKSLFDGCTCGIFHTRWATHGAKTDVNAHPHMDATGKIALVHNGIIENFYELKKEMKNIKFVSDTDTEIIANLIGMHYNDGLTIEKSIMHAASKMQGTWALLILCKDTPDVMYCARHGSPLLVGFGGSHIMVTSEQAGFGNNVTNYLCLNNGDITVIKKNINNNEVIFENIENYVLREISLKQNELTPYPYTHWTLKEINEQYDASMRAISFGGRLIDNSVKLGGIMSHELTLKSMDHLILLGCGTSLNAGNHSLTFFRDLCNFITVQSFDGSEFLSSDIPKQGKTCAIFISQSGETKDLYRCINICRNSNVFTIGVINVIDSMIAREMDCGCYLNAGREVGVASTKAFTSQVIVLSMIAIYFSQIHEVNELKREHYIKCLRQLPNDIKKTIKNTYNICNDFSKHLMTHEHMFILGKGAMLSVASEGSLKIKEIGYLHAEAYGGNALRHGPYALLEEGTPVIFLCSADDNYLFMKSTIEEVKSRNAYPIVISEVCDNQTNICVPVNGVYNGIIYNLPLQLIAYHIAVNKGHNPDMPKNLSKCVSV